MKTHLDIKHDGSMGDGDRVRMKFDEDSIAHLMSVLTDLYSDPELAVIREYATNAWDSHRAAGHRDPIEIELPTIMAPTFTVRDHGVGLTLDEIMDNLTKYGWSNKRDTDAEVGMLGLGFKSALTYTSQFTVKATKGGVTAIVLVTRDEDGCGAIQVVDTCATDDRNGVEVQIPVSFVDLFNKKVREFFSYWDTGSVFIDGEPVQSVWDVKDPDQLALDPDIVTSDNFKRNYIVMGGVPYPFEWPLGDNPFNENSYSSVKRKVAARVPIGSVNFTPSREALHMTKRSIEVIETIRDFVRDGVARQAQAEIDAAPNHSEAQKLATTWSSKFPQLLELKLDRGKLFPASSNGHHVMLTYKGEAIPRYINFHTKEANLRESRYGGSESRVWRWKITEGTWDANENNIAIRSQKAERLSSIGEADFKSVLSKNAYHVVGFAGNGIPNTLKLQIVEYLKKQGHPGPKDGGRYIYVWLYPARVGGVWMENANHLNLDAIKSAGKKTIAKPPSATQRWMVRSGNKRWSDLLQTSFAKDVEKVDDPVIVWITSQDYKQNPYFHDQYQTWVPNNVFFVRLQKSYEKAFHAAYPDAIHMYDWVIGEVGRISNRFNDYTRLGHTNHYTYGEDARGIDALAAFDPNGLLDPDLTRMVRCVQAVSDAEWNFVYQWYNSAQVKETLQKRRTGKHARRSAWWVNKIGRRINGTSHMRPRRLWVKSVMFRYPLLQRLAYGILLTRVHDEKLICMLHDYANMIFDPSSATPPTTGRRNLP